MNGGSTNGSARGAAVSIATGEDSVSIDAAALSTERTRRLSKAATSARLPSRGGGALARLSGSDPKVSASERKSTVKSPAKSPVASSTEKPPLKRKSLVQQSTQNMIAAAKLPEVQPLVEEAHEGTWLAQQALAAQEALRVEEEERVAKRKERMSTAHARATRRSLVAEVQQASLDMQLEDEATGDAEQNADADALMPLRDSAIAILGSGEDWKEEGAYGSIDVVVERELRAKSKSMSAMARGQVLSARTRGAWKGALAKLGHDSSTHAGKLIERPSGRMSQGKKASLLEDRRNELLEKLKIDQPSQTRLASTASIAHIPPSTRLSIAKATEPADDAEDPPEGTWLAVQAERSLRAERRQAAAPQPPPQPAAAAAPPPSPASSLGDAIMRALSSLMLMICVQGRSR